MELQCGVVWQSYWKKGAEMALASGVVLLAFAVMVLVSAVMK